MRWVLATGNQHKVFEMQALLKETSISFISQKELGIEDIEETGLSFIENALLKARNAASHSGLAALADDSGIVIDHLNGAPGIYSARFAGENASAAQNIEKVLAQMKGVPIEQRTARFYCVLAFVRHEKDPIPKIFQGEWEGKLLEQPLGSQGFGYDPIFWLKDYNCSAAQLPIEVKNKISHRGLAFAELLARIYELR
jgi:XTP/dITP diphosphohydrolase